MQLQGLGGGFRGEKRRLLLPHQMRSASPGHATLYTTSWMPGRLYRGRVAPPRNDRTGRIAGDSTQDNLIRARLTDDDLRGPTNAGRWCRRQTPCPARSTRLALGLGGIVAVGQAPHWLKTGLGFLGFRAEVAARKITCHDRRRGHRRGPGPLVAGSRARLRRRALARPVPRGRSRSSRWAWSGRLRPARSGSRPSSSRSRTSSGPCRTERRAIRPAAAARRGAGDEQRLRQQIEDIEDRTADPTAVEIPPHY